MTDLEAYGRNAFSAFDKSIEALQDTRILKRGGIIAYSVYSVAILLGLYLILSLFGNLTAIISEVIIVFGFLLGTGVLAGLLERYLSHRRREVAMQLAAESLRLKVELAAQRGSSILGLLESFVKANPKEFGRTIDDTLPGILADLDNVYQELGFDSRAYRLIGKRINQLSNQRTEDNELPTGLSSTT